MLGVGERPALGRGVERDAEAPVAGGGDGGAAPEGGGDALGEHAAAAVRPEQGHREGAVLGHRDHRRLRALVVQERGQRPHQDPGRAHPGDGPPVLEEGTQVAGRIREVPIGVGHALAKPMDLGIAERAGNPARERAAPCGQGDRGDARDHFHALPRRWTSTIEK